MNDRRLELQTLLEELLGNRHVYYQPPENLKMEYPCIRYKKNDISGEHGDNIKYIKHVSYEIIVIDKKPDNDVIGKILELPLTSYERHYVSDNLNHDVIIIFF